MYIALGEHDRAFDWLERAFAEHSLELTFIGAEPEVDAVRADPRFRSLLGRMNLPR